MRHDMYKVIVERPRRGTGQARSRPDPVDPEDSPRQEGIRKRHTSRKWLNENLRPLERYLASQVGRPWDKVYSEICAGIDRRNTVQQHIHQHLDDFVAVVVIEIDGRLHRQRGWWGMQPLDSTWGPRFYVDPHTGLLRRNRGRERARTADRDRRRSAAALRNGGHRPDLRVLDAANQLHRIDGVWYRVEIAPVAAALSGDPIPIDALRKIPVDQCPTRTRTKTMLDNHTLFGRADLYARSKRQLNARELRHYRLHNDNA